MTIYLKQSTASQEVPLGYFLDSTDGNTEETGLTINNTDIKLWKNGATTLANKNSGGATHISNGVYYAVLDATDTGTLGPMVIFVHVSGALAVRVETCVLAANIFDSLIGGGDLLDTSVVQWTGTNVATPDTAGYVKATIKSGTGTGELNLTSGVVDTNVTKFGGTNGTFASGRPEVNTSHIAGSAVSTSSAQIGVNVVNAAGTAWNSGAIGASTLATDTITAAKIAADAIGASELASDAATEIATAVWASGTRVLTANTNLNDLSAAGVRSAIGLASANLDTQLSTIDDFLDTEIAAIKAKTDNLPSDPADASDIAASFSTVNTKLDTIDDFIDTEVSAIKAKTDQLTFTTSNRVDSQVLGMEADSLTASALATDAVTEIQSGLSTLNAAGIRTAVGLATANLDTQLSTIDTVVDAIKISTDKLDDTVEDDSGTYRFTSNALEQAPTGGSAPTVEEIRQEIDDNSTKLASILTKANLIPGTQDGKTFAETLMLIASVLLGKASGLDTNTAVFRSMNDSKNRVTATIDGEGNRTAVTYNVS